MDVVMRVCVACDYGRKANQTEVEKVARGETLLTGQCPACLTQSLGWRVGEVST